MHLCELLLDDARGPLEADGERARGVADVGAVHEHLQQRRALLRRPRAQIRPKQPRACRKVLCDAPGRMSGSIPHAETSDLD